jgi:peptidoglycan/LPS O-acetylase OafA/YrhL
MGGNIDLLPKATGVAFVASLLVTIPAAEVLHWLVEMPSIWAGRALFDWIRE